MAVPVPAILSEETFEAAQPRLDRNGPMARRNNTTYAYLLRGFVSCGQCRLTCGGRTLHPGYHYSYCRGRTDALRLGSHRHRGVRVGPIDESGRKQHSSVDGFAGHNSTGYWGDSIWAKECGTWRFLKSRMFAKDMEGMAIGRKSYAM